MPFCQFGDCENYTEGGTDYCGTHNTFLRKERKRSMAPVHVPKPINKVSEKLRGELSQYSIDKAIFIKGKKCPVFPDEPALWLHHMRGKAGYADQWARDNGITLLMDKRFWLAVSMRGHRRIEENPTWAREMGYSLPRQGIINNKL